MYKSILVAILSFSILNTKAQEVQSIDNIKEVAHRIDRLQSIKGLGYVFNVEDSTGKVYQFYRNYIMDTVKGELIKAILIDPRFHLERVYYFEEERLIMFREKYQPPDSSKSWTHLAYVRDTDYAIAKTGKIYVYDNTGKKYEYDRGMLPIDNKYKLTTHNPQRQSHLEEAYIILMDFKKELNSKYYK